MPGNSSRMFLVMYYPPMREDSLMYLLLLPHQVGNNDEKNYLLVNYTIMTQLTSMQIIQACLLVNYYIKAELTSLSIIK